MYEIIAKKSVRRKIEWYVDRRGDVSKKLERLCVNPRRNCGAHPLHGDLKGKWGCWLGSNIRLVYTIDDNKKLIIAHSIGTHKVY